MSEDYVHAIITYKNTTVEFKGKPGNVLELIHKFLVKEVPNLEIAEKLLLDYSLPEIVEIFGDYIKLTPEGPTIIINKDKDISDKNLISLYLLSYKVAKLLGKSEKDRLSAQELQQLTNLKPKTISSRLSDLVKMRCVEKINEDGIKYRITTFGIHWLASEINKLRKG